jgi:hypothetical protein
MGCVLVVTSNEYKGRFVGFNMCGLQRNPDHLDAPEIPVPGTGYSLFSEEQGASFFSESDALRVRGRLKKLGVVTEQAHRSTSE